MCRTSSRFFMTSTHAANLRRMTQPWRGASRPWNDGSRRITDGSLLCQMKFRPPAPSARHQDGKADVVDQIARDAAQQDVTHPRMGEGADGEKIRPDIFCKILEGHGDAPAGRTDHMNVDLETMAGEVAGNIRAWSGAVAFGGRELGWAGGVQQLLI